MTTVAGRAIVVWWRDMDRWVAPSSVVLSRRLPAGWIRIRVGETVTLVSNAVRVESATEYRMAGVKWYGEGVFHRETVRGDAQSARWLSPLVPGALIYNRLFAWKASFALVPAELADCHVSNEFPQFLTDSAKLLPEYLYLWCISNQTIKAVNAASTGSAAVSRNRFREEYFLDFEIPLPPLPMQRKIVVAWEASRKAAAAAAAKIAQLERGIEARFLADLGLAAPAQAVLPKCFAMRWKDLLRWSVGHIRMSATSVDVSTGKFPVMPLREFLTGTMNGYCIRPVAGPTPHKMLKLSALRPEGLDLSESKYINIPEKTAERFHLRKGDLLICRSVGSFDHIAKCALVESDEPSVLFPDIIIRAQFGPRMLPEFAREFVQSKAGRTYFQQNARTAVGMWKIGGGDIANLPIPLPPLPIQRRIVERVAGQREEVARLKAEAAAGAEAARAEVEAMILGVKPAE